MTHYMRGYLVGCIVMATTNLFLDVFDPFHNHKGGCDGEEIREEKEGDEEGEDRQTIFQTQEEIQAGEEGEENQGESRAVPHARSHRRTVVRISTGIH